MEELAKSDPDVEIIWRSFELRPEPVPTLDPNGEYIQRAWQQSVLPLATRLGVNMVLPPVQPRSRLAHEATHWARAQGKGEEFHTRVFEAFYGRGEDISDIDILIKIADNLSLDAESMRTSLDNHEFLEDVLNDVEDAQALGLNSVPAFVADRRAALSGVQPVESLRQLIDYARK